MTNEEFDAFVEVSYENLERKQTNLARDYGVGGHPRWDFDHATGILRFGVDSEITTRAFRAFGIGSFSHTSQTFQWAWASTVLPDDAKARCIPLQGLAERTGMEVFSMPRFKATEEMAWQVAAMCVEHLDALGCYRAPSGNLLSFLLIESVLP